MARKGSTKSSKARITLWTRHRGLAGEVKRGLRIRATFQPPRSCPRRDDAAGQSAAGETAPLEARALPARRESATIHFPITPAEAAHAATLSTISPETLELARALAKEFSECMWWRHPDAAVTTREDAYLVVKHLREYGGAAALEMPLAAFQSEVLAVLAANRSEESHFAGGLVLNASPDSARFSRDFDIFHEQRRSPARAKRTRLQELERPRSNQPGG